MRIGSVPYLNALPLTSGAPYPIVFDTPRKLREMLMAGALDLALLSTVVLFESPDMVLVPGMGIGCKGPVKSVKLFFNKPGLTLQDLTTFKPSPESNTANMLAHLLLRRPPSDAADAEVVIGDAAMLRSDPYGSVDLGELWTQRTSLPFVFAAWISRSPTISKTLYDELLRCKSENLANIPHCIDSTTAFAAIPRHVQEAYLRDSIHYDLGDAELAGLNRFREECIRAELVTNANPIRVVTVGK